MLDFSFVKIVPSRILGGGSSARVYEGRFKNRICAIKVLYTLDITPVEIERTCREASLLKQLSSPHVVGLIGVAVLPPSICVVLELCSEGSLANVLYDVESQRSHGAKRLLSSIVERVVSTASGTSRSQGLSWSTTSSRKSAVSSRSAGRFSSSPYATLRSSNDDVEKGQHSSSSGHFTHELLWLDKMELALGASRGVQVLVKAMPGFSHNDIKSANFLVHRALVSGKLSLVTKLADVEFASKGETPVHLTEEGFGNPFWAAPEVFFGHEPVSPSSDIFSLGRVFYEIATRQVPFGNEAFGAVVEHLRRGQHPTLPDPAIEAAAENSSSQDAAKCEMTCRVRFGDLVRHMGLTGSLERPDVNEVVAELEAMRHEYLSDLSSIGAWDGFAF